MRGRIIRIEESNRLPFPRIGSLRIGYKNDRGFPTSVDYFIPTGRYAAMFSQAYGEKPSTIQIIFPDDEADLVCREEYEYRDDAGRRLAWGDGETFRVWTGDKYEEFSTVDYPNLMSGITKKHPNKAVVSGGDGWKVILSLNVICPLVRGIVGVWQFVTSGTASTIPQIREVFDKMQEERGSVKGVVFDLNVSFHSSQKPGSKSRFPVVSLVPNESEENITKIREALKPPKLLEN